MSEIWKPVLGYEGLYEVSSLGRVRSLDRIRSSGLPLKGKVLSPGGGKRHQFVNLQDGPRKQCLWVHRLVLAAFVGEAPEGMQCRHLDGDPTNNRLENLAWGTPKENSDDKIVHGTVLRGESHPLSKLTADQVRSIREEDGTQAEIGARHGVTQSLVSMIRSRAVWASV